jgi:hypothetical protein
MINLNFPQLNPLERTAAINLGLLAVAFGVFFAGCLRNQSVESNEKIDGAIVGNSMVPHFFGQHLAAECGRCGFGMKVETTPQKNEPLICANCGGSVLVDGEVKSIDSQAVIIDREAKIDRWTVIAFRHNENDTAGVKRVIGLPGETIWFENGNVMCQKAGEARILQKSMADQLATRVLVHDNFFKAPSPRWTTIAKPRLDRLSLPEQFHGDEYHWKRFLPRRCYRHLENLEWSPKLEDDYGFNQSNSRQLNPVNELMVECDLPVTNFAEVALMIRASPQSILVRFRRLADKVEIEMIEGANVVARATTTAALSVARETYCQVSNMDKQLLVAVNGEVVVRRELESLPVVGETAEIFLGVPKAARDVNHRVRLWRDIYYYARIPQLELVDRQKAQLKSSSGFFLVGDNVPVSSDSRDWENPTISRNQILGRVFEN